ncbi:MAG: hypothetical protein A2W93_01585 [Bacteroidetes bacterium GWF2_43_63]|nr:MAG: hypothetical protein A2W94_10490 [Bacteroidetes bacterium GWE2_42_42]OFY55760.1 MAG: hypothetical protein A2W93_01585 [Bacteroidetes bacterium GWF2_43_63]HBG71325.1 hypothetical protein [Bacteroidales bacterium]HCB60454.1 hypothetical protein [Bacteroidales bacterium]HCY22589.1 hypothetical protein [Bacteroidales bacterium]
MIMQFEIGWIMSISALLLWYILLPGMAMQLLFSRDLPLTAKAGNSFTAGFVLFSIIAFAGYQFGFSFEVIHLIYFIVTPLVLLIAFFSWRKRNTKRIGSLMSLISPEVIVVLIAAVGGFFVSLYSGWFPRGDAAIHLQVIRNMMSEGVVCNAYYSLPGNPIIPDHAYDTYYVLLVMISRFSGLELSIVWHYLSPVLSFLIPFVLYSLLHSLSASRSVKIFSLISFFFLSLYYWQIQYGSVFDTMVYPNRVYLWLMLPVAFSMLFTYMNTRKLLNVAGAALSVAAMLLVHQNGFLFFVIIATGVLFINVLSRGFSQQDNKKILTVIGLTILVSAPLLWLKLIPNFNYIHESSSQIWHNHYKFFYLSENLFAFSVKSYYKFGMLLALAATFYLLFRSRKADANRLMINFVASGFLAAFLIVFNPFVVPWLSDLISYVAIIRMLRMPMYFLMGGLVLSMIYKYLLNKYPQLFTAWKQRLAAVLLVLIFTGSVLLKVSAGTSQHELPLVFELKNIIQENSVVLSDPLTSTDIAEFHKIHSLVIQFNGAVDLVDMEDCKRDVDRLLNDSISAGEASAIIGKHDVDFVVVNSSVSEPVFRFENYSDRFSEVFNKNEIKVYRVLTNQPRS